MSSAFRNTILYFLFYKIVLVDLYILEFNCISVFSVAQRVGHVARLTSYALVSFFMFGFGNYGLIIKLYISL